MSKILTSPPAVEPVTLAEAKAHSRVTDAAEDGLISTLIAAARQRCEAATSLAFISQGWSVFRDGFPDGAELELPLWPIISVGTVKLFGEDDVPATVDPAHYFVDKVARPARLVLRSSRIWPRPGRVANGVEIQATAGFGTAASDVPQPLREAILKLVACWFERRGDEREEMPHGLDALLLPYRSARL
jgi:uncharacterized phiE125 gp8 family phage protein